MEPAGACEDAQPAESCTAQTPDSTAKHAVKSRFSPMRDGHAIRGARIPPQHLDPLDSKRGLWPIACRSLELRPCKLRPLPDFRAASACGAPSQSSSDPPSAQGYFDRRPVSPTRSQARFRSWESGSSAESSRLWRTHSRRSRERDSKDRWILRVPARGLGTTPAVPLRLEPADRRASSGAGRHLHHIRRIFPARARLQPVSRPLRSVLALRGGRRHRVHRHL